MDNITMEVRAYPIDEPKNNTLAYASVAFKAGGEGLAAIRGIRVVSGENGTFAAMPQSRDKDGGYHDIAFPLDGGLRKELNAAVVGEYEKQAGMQPEVRGYAKTEPATNGGAATGDVTFAVRAFPIAEPKGRTLAFANATIGAGGVDVVAIRGLRVVGGENGAFVSMPQSKGGNGEFHDVAFPLSGGLRKEICEAVLAEYGRAAERGARKQGIGERLSAGAEKAAASAATAPRRESAAKARPPSIGA